MPLDRQDIEQALENKLRFGRWPGDHRIFTLHINGKLVARTKTSHSSKHKAIDDYLVTQMAKQLFVTRKFFVDLVRCTKTRADYLQSLVGRGIISVDAITE